MAQRFSLVKYYNLPIIYIPRAGLFHVLIASHGFRNPNLGIYSNHATFVKTHYLQVLGV